MLPLMGCTMIPTTDDDILEGDHNFSVAIDSISPDGAVSITGLNDHMIIITDDADGKSM